MSMAPPLRISGHSVSRAGDAGHAYWRRRRDLYLSEGDAECRRSGYLPRQVRRGTPRLGDATNNFICDIDVFDF